MIWRNPKARKAKAKFLASVNDIDVYVEDLSRETKKLFSRLLSNAWKGKIKFESVVPLGRRSEVLDACKADQVLDDGRRRVYVIDGDLDLLFQIPTEELLRLYRLPRYCVENFLIDEHAVAECVAYESEDLDAADVQKRLEFEDWIASNAVPMRRLFLGYAAAKKLDAGIATVSTPLSTFKSDASGLVDPLKVEAFLCSLRSHFDQTIGPGEFDRDIDRLGRGFLMVSDRDFMLRFVSGKDYLFPLLRLRMGAILHIQRRDGLLKCNLAERVVSSELADMLEVAI
jgi:hypothetical protein